MHRTSLHKRALASLAVVGLAATLAGPAAAAKPLPIIKGKIKIATLKRLSPVARPLPVASPAAKPLPITDPPTFVAPTASSTKPNPVPPRMPPGPLGPPTPVISTSATTANDVKPPVPVPPLPTHS